MNGKAFAWLVTLTLVIVAAAAGPCWASTIVPHGVDDAWHNQPVKVTFIADGQKVTTKYRLAGDAPWREGDQVTLSAEGVNSLDYLSSTKVGTVMPVTDATFDSKVLQHHGLVLVEFWEPG